MTCTLILPELRTNSCTTEPCKISNQRERVDLPMTIWVTLLACAKLITSSAILPGAARDRDRFAAERLRQAQRVGEAVALFLGELQAALRLHAERRPWRMQPVGQPLGVAHQPGRAYVLAHANQDALARRPRPLDGVLLHVGEQLLVHPISGSAQRQLA